MYLYDTPRDTMAKDMMLQSLCSTSTRNALELMPNISNYIFHVFQSFMLNTNVSIHVLQSLSLNPKHLIDHVLQVPLPTQNISSIMCFRVHTQQNQHIYTYIIKICLMPNIQSKSSCSYVVGSLTQKNKTSI